MLKIKKNRKNGIWILAVLFILNAAKEAQAVPSFARQTGMSCAICHTVFPELTSFGRSFKLNGYVLNNTKKLKEETADGTTRFAINDSPPLAAMIEIADTFTQNPPAAGTAASNGSDKNGSLEFPSQFSLFYAGSISPKMGAFVQITYDSASGAFAMDNTDVRFADSIQLGETELIVGLTANNNPTVQDIFNTTPAWGFPYSGGNTAITPSAASMIESAGGSVGGLGLYAFWNQVLYAEFSGYRTAPQGGPTSADIQGFAPYWRFAFTKDFETNSFEIGTFGMDARTYPDGQDPSLYAQDDISDIGGDVQLQLVGKEHMFTIKGNCIWENQKWSYSQPAALGPANLTDTFTTVRADATYYYDRAIGATLGYFATNGSADTGLYAAMPNIPDSTGWVLEVNYLPWYNTKFSLQYTLYDKFDGAATNYDGAGRNAADNNTLMVMAWLMY